MRSEHEELLRRLALNDVRTLEGLLGDILDQQAASTLDPKTHAVARVAALVATESPVSSYLWAVESAIETGARDDEIVDVLTAIAPVVGLARLSAAAPRIALALGYDVESTTPPR
ncbi:MAG: carboxymuconolactone decarboxylase family protein [Ilumatobacteraceae bacterium]